MSKWIALGIFPLVALYSCAGYNGAVSKDEAVKSSWSQVENSYQRRSDLIPNLVEVVKGYAAHERATLKEVIEARASAMQMKIDPSSATPEDLVKYQQAQGMLSQALGRLMVLQEQYPNLKADSRFAELQAEVAGTENRIAVARRDFNLTAQGCNTYCRGVPSGLFCRLAGVTARAYFKSDAGTSKAPQVRF